MLGHDEFHGPEGQAIAQRVREELARRRISRQALADMARISISTLEKALAGRRAFTLATVIRLEEALGAPLRNARALAAAAGPAPEAMGAYTRPAIRWIEGTYLTLRPSFSDAGSVYAYLTTIAWDDAANHLRFAESRRADQQFSQTGHVSMPNLSGHIYLVTNDAGQYRLTVLGRATREGRLFGVLTTLQVGAGSQLIPTACPIALVPVGQVEQLETGVIEPASPVHATYRPLLDAAVAQDFARFRM